jgi:hypothetical protein
MKKMSDEEYITLKPMRMESRLYIEPAQVAGKPGSLIYDSEDCFTSAPSGAQIYDILTKATQERNGIDSKVAEALLDIEPVLALMKVAEKDGLTKKTVLTDKAGRETVIDRLTIGAAAQTEKGEISMRVYLRERGMPEAIYGDFVRDAKQAFANLETKYRQAVCELGRLYGREIELDMTDFSDECESMMPEPTGQDCQEDFTARIKASLKRQGIVITREDMDQAANF